MDRSFHSADDMVKAQDAGVIQMYRVIKAMLALGYGGKRISLTAVTIKHSPYSRRTLLIRLMQAFTVWSARSQRVSELANKAD